MLDRAYPPADRAELRARAKAAFEFALDALHGTPGTSGIPYRDTRDMLGALLPRWAADVAEHPDAFRRRHFGDGADPVDAWSLQKAAAAMRDADTHAGLRHAGAELAEAIHTVGLPAFHGFLQAAQRRATALDAPPEPAVRLVGHATFSRRGAPQGIQVIAIPEPTLETLQIG